MNKQFQYALRTLSCAILFFLCLGCPEAQSQILSIQTENAAGNTIETWNSGRWVLQCGSTLSCSVSSDGSTFILQATGTGGGATPGGSNYSVQYNIGGASLGGLTGNGLVLANGTTGAPTIVPLYGTQGHIPTISNTGVNGDAVLFGSAGLVDSGYVPENVANKGAASGYAPLNSSSQVPLANLALATNSVAGVLKPDGSSCTVSAGVLTCASGTTVNTLSGAVTLAAGTGVTLSVSGHTITISSTGSGSGTPGGSTGGIQYNNAGAFGGVNITGLVKGTGTGAPVTAVSGTDYSPPLTITCTSPLSCTPSGSTYSFTVAGGTLNGGVQTGNAYELSTYPAAGTIVGPSPDVYVVTPSMTLAQINTLFTTVPADSTVIIPAGVPQYPWNNYSNIHTRDFRAGMGFLEISQYGIACDAQQWYVSITSGSNQILVGSDFGAESIGKTMTFSQRTGYGPTAVQNTWTPTIIGYSYPYATMSSNAPFTATGFAQTGTLNTNHLQQALDTVGYALPLNIPAGCKMLTGTLSWNSGQSIIGQSANGSGFVGLPGQDILRQPDGSQITAYSINSSNVGTFTSINDFVPGDYVTLHNFGTSTFLNGYGTYVTSATHTQFTGYIGHAAVAATVETGYTNPGSAGYPGLRLENVGFTLDAGVDRSFAPVNSYDANAALTVLPALYRPLYELTQASNNPCAPGWVTGCQDGVASTTASSAVMCVPSAYTRPTIGNTIVFPYTLSTFTTTVLSYAGTCATGSNPVTLNAAIPSGAGNTVAQQEWFAGTAVQTTATAIPTNPTYPMTITGNLPTLPVPGFENNVATHGRIRIGNSEFDYMLTTFLTNVFTLERGPATTPGYAAGSTMVPVNPCYARYDQPWPIIPTINTNDSTPSGANFFPGHCGGAAAIAFPSNDGRIYTGTALVKATLHNLQFSLTNNSPQNTNGSIAFYQAGNNTGYSSVYDNFAINNYEYGFEQGPASAGQHAVAAVGPTSAGQSITNCSITAGYPISLVNFQQSNLDRCDTYTTAVNPFDGTTIGAATALHLGFTLDEQTGGLVTNTAGMTITNWNSEPENGTHIEVPVYMESDCSQCTFIGDDFEGAFNIFDGDHQFVQNGVLSNPMINYGVGNVFQNLINLNTEYIQNAWNAQFQFINWGYGGSCSSDAGGYNTTQPCSSGFVQPSNGHDIYASSHGILAHPPENVNGGMITPGEWNTQYNLDVAPMSLGFVIDPTELWWGSYAACNLGGGARCTPQSFDNFNGYIFIGPHNRIVDGPYILTADFKTAAAASTFQLSFGAYDNGDGSCTNPGGNLGGIHSISTTTSWSQIAVPVDFTGRAGCILQVNFGSGSTTDQLRVGFFNFNPVPGYVDAAITSPTVGNACPANVPSGAMLGSDTTNVYWCANGTIKALPFGGGGGGGGSGTVTSAALTMPSWLAVGGSPITTTGTFAVTPATGQTSHQVLGTCGTATSFAPCALTASDIPTLNQPTTGNAATATSAATVNGNNYPASSSFISGGIPYFSSTSAEASSALLTHYGVIYGGGAGGAPVSTPADTNTNHVLLAGSPPAFGAITAAMLPVGSSSAFGALECGTGTTCTAGVISVTSSGNVTSSTLTSGVIPVASGAGAIANSALSDSGTKLTYTGTGGMVLPAASALAFGTGTAGGMSICSDGSICFGNGTASNNTATIEANNATIETALTAPSVTATTFTGGSVIVGAGGNLTVSSTSRIALGGSYGTAGQALISGGPSSPPSWGSAGTSGPSASIYTHTITGASPAVVVNSSSSPSTDIDYLTMSANVTSLTLPASSAIADGEMLTITIAQPASGSAYTLPTGSALSPLTAGSGTSLVNLIPGGCPTIGTTLSSTAPSQLVISLAYRASLTQYQVLGCETASPSQTAVVEASLPAGTGQYGASSSGAVLVGTTMNNGGHFTNLQVINTTGGTCTTPPTFNVFDGTTNVGTAVAALGTIQAKGSASNQSETLTFSSGDNVGIYVSAAGSGCTGVVFSVTAQYGEP